MSEILKEAPAEQRNWRPKFRPTEVVLAPDLPPSANHHPRRDPQILRDVHFNSGRSAIDFMDRQYEGIDPDRLLSGEVHETTVFEASDLTGTIGE